LGKPSPYQTSPIKSETAASNIAGWRLRKEVMGTRRNAATLAFD
jgi:hypothetical protein